MIVMNCSDPVTLVAHFRPRMLRLPLWIALALSLAGCSTPQIRSQKEEETEKERYPVRTVGDVSTFSNAEPVVVTGVGLVEGLEGTGSPAPAGDLRQLIEHELQREKVKDIKAILNSKDYSIVIVNAIVPPGARKGDKLDLDVVLPPGSRTTSLRGGYLHHCFLYNFEYTAANHGATPSGPNGPVRGHPLVRAEGALLAGISEGDDGERMRKARIWGGGVSQVDRQFHILLNSTSQFTAVAANLANRINASFQGTIVMTPGNELAVAKSNTIVVLNIPAAYKLNLPRYLRVIRMVPLEDVPPRADDKKKHLPYREQLVDDVLDPTRTLVAALRLEALGTASIPALKEGLKHEHPLVRFCSAEALAYLGSPSAGDELAKAVAQQPYLRAFALTAMASLDEAVCHVKLAELMASNFDDETRYGAFRALRSLDEKAAELGGELLDETYWLHEVAPGSKSLVHFTTNKRAEIVIFGKTPKLVAPFSILSGEFAITAQEGAEFCKVTHIPLHGGEQVDGRPIQASMELPELIRILANHGASYPEVIEVIRQASACKNLTCRVVTDALPQAITAEQVAGAGRQDLKKDSPETVQLIKPDANFGATPTLYQKDTPRRRSPLKG
jgi:hypothetical protein